MTSARSTLQMPERLQARQLPEGGHQLVCAAADPRGGQEDQGAHLREQGHGTNLLRQAHHGEIGPSAGLQRKEDEVA